MSERVGRQRAIKHNPSVMGVWAIVFSIITADLLILLASDLEVWTVLLTVLLGLFQRGKGFRRLFLNKALSYQRERYKCNHALKMMCNSREDSEKGTVLSSTAGPCVFVGQEAL